MLALRLIAVALAFAASGRASFAPRVGSGSGQGASDERVVASGRVFDPDGAPVAGAEVRFEVGRRGWSVADAVAGTTGHDGRFELRGAVAPGVDGEIRASAGERRTLAPPRARAGAEDVVLVIARPASLVGRVVVPRPAPDNLVLELAPRGGSAGRARRVERVGALGRVDVLNLMPGVYDVELRADATDALLRISGLEIAEGARVAPPELDGFDPAPLTLFDVRVSARDRRALEATIDWRPANREASEWSTWTAPGGVMRIGARHDAIVVRAWAPGYQPAEVDRVLGGAPAGLELAPGLDVRLVLEPPLDLPRHVQRELALVPLARDLARFESTVGRKDDAGAYRVRAAVIGPHAAVLRVRMRDRYDPADPASPYDLGSDPDRPWTSIEIGRVEVVPVEGEQAYVLAPPAEALARAARGG